MKSLLALAGDVNWKGRKMRSAFAVILCSSLVGLVGSSTYAAEKSVKECTAEWQAHKADNQAKGITEAAYVAQCRGGTLSPSNTAAPAPAPVPSTTPRAATATATPATSPAPATATPTGANQFAAEGQAKAHCPSDTVVWANLNSKVYHFGGSKDYGNTKKGAYVCEKDATAQGFRAAKNEKHP
jgi:hypothetical protein